MNMKRLIYLSMIIIVILIFAGCTTQSLMKQELADLIPMVMVKGKLYLDTGNKVILTEDVG